MEATWIDLNPCEANRSNPRCSPTSWLLFLVLFVLNFSLEVWGWWLSVVVLPSIQIKTWSWCIQQWSSFTKVLKRTMEKPFTTILLTINTKQLFHLNSTKASTYLLLRQMEKQPFLAASKLSIIWWRSHVSTYLRPLHLSLTFWQNWWNTRHNIHHNKPQSSNSWQTPYLLLKTHQLPRTEIPKLRSIVKLKTFNPVAPGGLLMLKAARCIQSVCCSHHFQLYLTLPLLPLSPKWGNERRGRGGSCHTEKKRIICWWKILHVSTNPKCLNSTKLS